MIGYREWQHAKEAPLREGISAYQAGKFDLALARLEPFAKRGNRRAQRFLGDMYARGFGVPVDEAQATMWFRRAECGCEITGENEYAVALNLLDINVSEAKTLATRWLQRSAEAGHPHAQRLLADPVALSAKGVKVDSSVVDYWRHRTLGK